MSKECNHVRLCIGSSAWGKKDTIFWCKKCGSVFVDVKEDYYTSFGEWSPEEHKVDKDFWLPTVSGTPGISLSKDWDDYDGPKDKYTDVEFWWDFWKEKRGVK
jgi:hypothetical protein